jgi:pimeloyl-ACP methyl ester carboxylesterase
MAAGAAAVLDDLAIERAHVMGLSLGGMIVQTMAIEHPDRLLTMTSVMSRTGDADTGRSTEAALQRFMAPAPVDRASYIAASIENLRTWGSPACFDEERIAANRARPSTGFDPDGQTRQAKAAMASGSRTEALRTVGVPTLVLHGDADTLIDQSGGRRTAEAIRGARFVLIEGLGHDYPPQYWDQWVELVTAHTHGVPANGG